MEKENEAISKGDLEAAEKYAAKVDELIEKKILLRNLIVIEEN